MADKTYSIPNKGKEFVQKWAQRIKPLVEKKGKLWEIKPCDLYNVAFPWDAKTTCKQTDLVEVARIKTLHGYGYYGFFKPSIAEVIQQIPEELLEEVRFFLVRGPKDSSDLNEQWDIINDGFHQAETILYK